MLVGKYSCSSPFRLVGDGLPDGFTGRLVADERVLGTAALAVRQVVADVARTLGRAHA
ncbi:MAG: hypothetical protein ACRDRH_08765 [Pseudonocardia sp.]